MISREKGRLRQLASCSILALIAASSSDPASAAIEYVRVCNAYGAGFFYIPGTSSCATAGNLPYTVDTQYGTISLQPGTNAAAYGFSSFSNGTNSVAVGDHAFSGGNPFSASPGAAGNFGGIDGQIPVSAFSNANTTALGQASQAGAGATGQDNATAIGQGAMANIANGTALGQGAVVTATGGVALGQGSVADQANTVSVGAVGAERRIVNVAPGTIAAGSTDAVNGAQLFATNQSIAALQPGLVQQADSGALISVGGNTGGSIVSLAGVAGNRQLTGLAAGTLAANSSDAVIGAQLFATNAQVAANATAIGILQGQTTAAAAANAANAAGLSALQANGTGLLVTSNPGGAATPVASGKGAIAGGFGAVASGGSAVAIGTGAQATQFGATALGTGAVASGDPTTAVGFNAQATGNEASAFGGFATATGDNATALGRSANAAGVNAVAVGAFASAAQPNSVAIGQGVATTRANQVAIGSATQTYTLAGLASAQSLAAQTGATTFVTTDASGNLAASQVGPGTLAALDGRVSSLEAGLDGLSRYAVESRKEARRGIASAMALASAPLPSAPGRLTYVLNGATFRGEYAVGGSIAYRLDTNHPIAVTLGVAGGAGNVGGRVGIMGEL